MRPGLLEVWGASGWRFWRCSKRRAGFNVGGDTPLNALPLMTISYTGFAGVGRGAEQRIGRGNIHLACCIDHQAALLGQLGDIRL